MAPWQDQDQDPVVEKEEVRSSTNSITFGLDFHQDTLSHLFPYSLFIVASHNPSPCHYCKYLFKQGDGVTTST